MPSRPESSPASAPSGSSSDNMAQGIGSSEIAPLYSSASSIEALWPCPYSSPQQLDTAARHCSSPLQPPPASIWLNPYVYCLASTSPAIGRWLSMPCCSVSDGQP